MITQAKPFFISKYDFVWINSIVDDPSAKVIPLLLVVGLPLTLESGAVSRASFFFFFKISLSDAFLIPRT